MLPEYDNGGGLFFFWFFEEEDSTDKEAKSDNGRKDTDPNESGIEHWSGVRIFIVANIADITVENIYGADHENKCNDSTEESAEDLDFLWIIYEWYKLKFTSEGNRLFWYNKRA